MVRIKKDYKINGYPILSAEEYGEFIECSTLTGCFLKPVYESLPDFSDLDEDEKAKYKYKNIVPGIYLVGLEIMTNEWFNLGAAGYILSVAGLVISEANPVKKIDDSRGGNFIYIRFRHI